eukprot:767382-Hanusia_phi.AAC.9
MCPSSFCPSDHPRTSTPVCVGLLGGDETHDRDELGTRPGPPFLSDCKGVRGVGGGPTAGPELNGSVGGGPQYPPSPQRSGAPPVIQLVISITDV